MQKLGKLLEGVEEKRFDLFKYTDEEIDIYNQAISDLSNLSVCIDEEKVRTLLRGHELFTKGGYDKWIHSTPFRDALAKAISQSNIITLKRGE